MLNDLVFDISECAKEVKEFGKLLKGKTALKERTDILKFFRRHQHISAFIALYDTHITKYNKIKHEYNVAGKFQADLIVGDSTKHAYCLIEFEEGAPGSIFKKKSVTRSFPEWSGRFEHGYSQIIDWFWCLDDIKKTTMLEEDFGHGDFSVHGILVIGRSVNLSDTDRRRLLWRSNKVVIDSHIITCLTYDMLYEDMSAKLEQVKGMWRL